jgi:hypothetical protein
MKKRLLRSFLFSIEWRIIAFVITGVFLWVVTGELFQATMLSLGVHALLLVGHSIWLMVREESIHEKITQA